VQCRVVPTYPLTAYLLALYQLCRDGRVVARHALVQLADRAHDTRVGVPLGQTGLAGVGAPLAARPAAERLDDRGRCLGHRRLLQRRDRP
jgi:hypothetical protein